MQANLAKLLGVHKGSVQNWERNIYPPGPGFIRAIVEWLGYDPTPGKSAEYRRNKATVESW